MSNYIDNDCADCARLKDMLGDAETANAELGRQLAGMDLLVRRAGKTEVALRNELARQREEEPEAIEIKAVLNHWKLKLEHQGAKTPLTGERAKKVRARLKDRFTVEDLKRAVDGCARLPYVGAGGRKATGSKRERHDDLTIICRDEETVERFKSYATDAPPAASRPTPSGPSGVEALLNRLEGVKQAKPGQWNAKCPAHDDRHASLSVGQGSKGAVVHCHAGCSAEAIAHAAGLDVPALFDPEPVVVKIAAPAIVSLPSILALGGMADRLQTNRKLLDRLVELRGWTAPTLARLGVGFDGERLTLPVFDGQGGLVNVVRYSPRPKNGPKTLAAKGRPRNLFPAPEDVEGPELWLVEGEPDAISGHELGLPAVAVPGVNGWRQEWAQRLTGRSVVVCMDCDEPGRAAAQRIVGELPGAKVIDLEPERTDGYDLSDALLEGADGDFLRVMASFGGVAA